MSDELPEIFRRLTPLGAPAELREKVLSAVKPHLVRRKKPRWERIVEWSVAASLALGVGLNAWAWRTEGARAAAHSDVLLTARKAAPSARRLGTAATSRWHSTDLFGSERYQALVQELSQGRIPKSL